VGDRHQTTRELNRLAVTNRRVRHLDTTRALLKENISFCRASSDGGRLAVAPTSLSHAGADTRNQDLLGDAPSETWDKVHSAARVLNQHEILSLVETLERSKQWRILRHV
jgi:hypothetical protein